MCVRLDLVGVTDADWARQSLTMPTTELTVDEQESVVQELRNRWWKRRVAVQASPCDQDEHAVDVKHVQIAYKPVAMTVPGRTAVGLGAIHVDAREAGEIVLAGETATA